MAIGQAVKLGACPKALDSITVSVLVMPVRSKVLPGQGRQALTTAVSRSVQLLPITKQKET